MLTMTRMTRRGRSSTGVLTALVLALAGCLTAIAGPSTADEAGTATTERTTAGTTPTVIGSRRIGHSVRDRPIRAYHLGEPGRTTAVVIGSMHGNEKAGLRIVDALRTGRPVVGVDLWVIRTVNPDGVARDTRQNARGVDLNRNFPHHWAALTGTYYSGTGPLSEPESRALKRFLHQVRPTYVVSFHQPLHGVGRDDERRPFQRRLARGLGLRIKPFNCSGVCHGTMTSWYNAHHDGTAITVELGPSPSRRYLRGKAVRGTLSAVLGSRA